MKIYCSKRKLSQTLITLFLFTHTHTYTCTYLICKHVICHYILLLMSYTFTRVHTHTHLYILAYVCLRVISCLQCKSIVLLLILFIAQIRPWHLYADFIIYAICRHNCIQTNSIGVNFHVIQYKNIKCSQNKWRHACIQCLHMKWQIIMLTQCKQNQLVVHSKALEGECSELKNFRVGNTQTFERELCNFRI